MVSAASIPFIAVAQGDPLVQGGEGSEFDPASQGGLPHEKAGERAVRVELGVGEEPGFLELVDAGEVGFVEDDHDVAAAFVFFGGEQVGGLWDEHRLLVARGAAEGQDDPGVEAAGSDGGVAELDDGGAACVQAGQGGPDRDGLAGADLTGDGAEGPFGQAPADPGDCFAVGVVACSICGASALLNGERVKP